MPEPDTAVHAVSTRAPCRLVDYLRARLIVTPARAVGPLIARGGVQLGGARGQIADLVRTGDAIAIDRAALVDVLEPEPWSLVIHHEDDDFLVVDKPAGVHVHPQGPHRTGTLLGALLWHAGARPDLPWGAWRPSLAHRLDRATSGLITIAKHAAAHEAFRALLDRRAVVRRYRAVVVGDLVRDRGTIDAALGRDPTRTYRQAVVADGKHAVTHWRVIARPGAHTVVELELETGRTHQIRAHLACLGHPIAGDVLYASAGAPATQIALHATTLEFVQPMSGALIQCRSEPAVDYR